MASVPLGNKVEVDVDRGLDELHRIVDAPVRIRTSSGAAEFSAEQLGLSFDEKRTITRAMEQPRNPLRRFLSVFGIKRHVRPVVTVDRAKFDKALDGERKNLEKAAVEGGVHFEVEGDHVVPKPDMPSGGLRINRDLAAQRTAAYWLDGDEILLPMEPFQPTVSAALVMATVNGKARQAVAAPVTLKAAARRSPSSRRSWPVVGLRPRRQGALVPKVDDEKLKQQLTELSSTNQAEECHVRDAGWPADDRAGSLGLHHRLGGHRGGRGRCSRGRTAPPTSPTSRTSRG